MAINAYSGYTPGTSYTNAQGQAPFGTPDPNALNQLMALSQQERSALPVANILKWMGSRRPADVGADSGGSVGARPTNADPALQLAALQGGGDTFRPQSNLVGKFVAPVGGTFGTIGGYTAATANTPGARAAGWVDRRDAYAPSSAGFSGPMGPSRASLDSGSSGASNVSTGSPSFRLSPQEIADFSRQNFGAGRAGVRTNVAQGVDYSDRNNDEENAVQELIRAYRAQGGK